MAVVAKRAVSRPISLPSPTGGWNARDALPNMNALDAVTLENFYPATTECTLRYGYSQYATGITGQVETLMSYSGATSNKFFAIASGNVYDVTSSGAVGSPVLTGLLNSRWQYCNVATSGGNYLYMANGSSSPYLYNGSTWTQITGVSSPIAITGVTTSTLNSPILYQNRLFFIEQGSLRAWYLPTQSVGGAANKVDLSTYAYKGGYIVAHATWTIDAGQGVNDHYALVTNKGQVIVFQGTNPADANAWSMVGVWDIGAPVGARSMLKYAGDLLLITEDGVVPMSAALQSSRVNPKVAITDKIQYAVSEAVTNYGDNFGWQLTYVPTINQLWLNVPISTGTNVQQFVMNTITGAWCNYTGWNANCFELYDDWPYFGGNGFVAKAWNTTADGGNNIQAFGLQAFNNFQSGGTLKRFTMARPIMRTNGKPAIYVNVNVDFSLETPFQSLEFAPSSFGTWDSAIWDAATWGGGLDVQQQWQGVNGVGYYGAPFVKVASNGIELKWVGTDLVIEGGGIL